MSRQVKICCTLTTLLVWLIANWLPIFKNYHPSGVKTVEALNKVNNWNFDGDSTGWIVTNGTGTDVCGSNTSTAETAFETFTYDGTIGNSAGSFKSALNTTTNNINRKGKLTQTLTAPGTGNVKVKGRFDYYSSGVSWAVAGSWVRLDIYDQNDSNFIANLACVNFGANTSWTTVNFGSDAILSGGTSYTIRLTIRTRNTNTDGANTIWTDNIIVNFAPVGFSLLAPSESTNVQLDWSTSTAGTGAPGLHATTPYKMYRDTGTPASSFLANSATNSYTDSSTSGNTTYYYAVTDYDTVNIESPFCVEQNILTLPGAPSGLSFSNITSNSLTLNWSAPSGGSPDYRVERAGDVSGSPGTWQERGTTADTFYNDTGLSGALTYWYRVRGYNATGNGAYSANSSQTTPGEVSISLTTDGVISYGIIPPSNTKDNSASGVNDVEVVRIDSGPVDLDIKTSAFSDGVHSWTFGSSSGSEQVHWEYSKDATNWNTFLLADSLYTFDTNLSQESTVNVYLRITVPSNTTSYNPHTSTVTIVASAP